ncbi:translocase of chloroplast 90, chloroplastic isoform X2 [Malania oleifera]|uniref:translocase of chloroplast 90, chloroplastic isoform X2 n=1 Tax=Malania oleifera TaxID=397392 RepID=UPI0025ADD7E3|nr:translocase of chloroplast 90, chloroplastic isoform X2 [Malania oleifera]XP_057968224.1 translocase of chloroplast 90, chloroplastic isoform X2 [Malania oleifera]
MRGIKDWVLSQLLSPSFASSRPMPSSDSFFNVEPLDEESNDQVHPVDLVGRPESDDSSCYSNNDQENRLYLSAQQVPVEEDSHRSLHCSDRKKLDPLARIEGLQIKFLRLLRRLGLSQDNLVVAKVLYRLQLATLIRARESDLKRANLRSDRTRVIAAEQEAAGFPELDFPVRILVLGKTGVGKSATINSIFDQRKAMTSAFQPATDRVQEVVGDVNGIKFSIIDTPGLLPSSTSNMRRNRKTLLSVRRFIRKSPPDIVLYFERLDLVNFGNGDFPLLKLITDVFGSEIWFNTILVMTHSSSALPEGPTGYPVSYESHVAQCTELVQHYIHQAVSDSKLENLVLLVENHPHCRTNVMGEKILPNGQVWKSHFLLLSVCYKVLSDANAVLDFQDSFELGPVSGARSPSLPHLLSSLLRHRSLSSSSETGNENDETLTSELEDEDEYDQLPPIRILTKSQFAKLTNSQKKDYLDELDYRETLYLKKQLKEESRRKSESKLAQDEGSANDDISDNQEASPEAVLLPDMAVPPNFDSDCPVHRYRCLVTTDRWLLRPVLDPHGWDHDVGFDGINLEAAVETKKNVLASVTGQISKDKQDFIIQSECSAAYANPRWPTYGMGLDAQSAGKDLICTVHSSAKVRNLKHNITECAVSVTSFGNKYYVGGKLEDTIAVGKRLKFVMNFGQMVGLEQVAYGGSLEATLRGRDYPVKNDFVSLTMTALSFNKEMVISGSFQSDFRLNRGTKMSFNANLNNRKMGQICVKTSSNEHMGIALIALISILRALFRRKATSELDKQTLEKG